MDRRAEHLAALRQAAARRPPAAAGDLRSAAAQLLAPRLSADLWDDGEALHVAPDTTDLRRLLREEQERRISMQQATDVWDDERNRK